MNTRWRMFAAVVVTIIIGIAACEKDTESESMLDADAERNAPRGFRVEITDSPANYSRMDLEIVRVEAYHDIEGWILLNVPVRSINILSLAKGAKTTIGIKDDAPLGHYSGVRIWFGDNATVTVNSAVTVGGVHIDAGGIVPLKWMPGTNYAEVKINKVISEERGASVLLDFDAEKSVTESDEAYWFKPAIRVMTYRLTGVFGTVHGGDAAAFIRLYNHNYIFSAYSTPEGAFLVRGVVPGEYQLLIRVMKRNDAGEMEEKVYTRDGILVPQGQLTLIDGIDL